MYSLLLAVIYLIFISLGLPDSLLGSGWPSMRAAFGVPSSYAGYVSMSISFMTIISALLSPRMMKRFHTKWIVTVSIFLTVMMLPISNYLPAAVGFILIGTGMGPVYPAIQHMAPENFGRRNSAAVISLQMASAYVGSTFMPMVFGNLQQHLGIGIMPYYLLIFAVLNLGMLERTYVVLVKKKG